MSLTKDQLSDLKSLQDRVISLEISNAQGLQDLHAARQALNQFLYSLVEVKARVQD